ncbi:hypothetical protein [Lentibacillus cibarius]|uniref:hypothetical protein n=1 Tax=Lentibacillus cibarius TaxID=2583219 RepID=UPI00163D68F4|nr:hypothetical protein [Lentibacillus cibarius]
MTNLEYAADQDKQEGWIFSLKFLMDIQSEMLRGKNLPYIAPSLEAIEEVLLAYENLKD